MDAVKSLQKLIGIGLAIVFLVGCAAPTAMPTPLPTLPPPLQPKTPIPPPPQPDTPLPPPTQAQPTQADLFTFIQTVQVTPDDQYLTGAFSRISYVPATDRFVVTFGGTLAKPAECPLPKVFSYKEYTTDLQETGKSETFSCDGADAGSVMVDNTYYFAAMAKQANKTGWHLLKIDAANWKTLVDTFFAVDYPKEGEADPMVAYVNGQIDISSAYNISGEPHKPSDPAGTYGTHHQFFSTDLEFLSKKILTEPGHIHGSYMVFVDGIYNLVTADAYDGDIIVAKYDKDWKYLEERTLIKQGHFSTGLVYDGQRFYVAYTDTSQRPTGDFFPAFLNIHLAAFDREWNLLDDVAVTSYTPQDGRQPGRPWVILHKNRLYVSYDVDKTNPDTHEEYLEWQAYVSVYELAQGAP